jgi:hypothetical protein
VTDITPEPTHITKGPRRAPLLIALAVLALAGLGTAVFVVNADDKRDPDEALASAQNAVKDAKSFRFTLRMTDVSAEGDDDAGSETTDHVTADGEWSEGTWHIATEDEYATNETVIITPDGTAYYQYIEDPDSAVDDYVDQQWDKVDAAELGHRGQMLDVVREMGESIDEDSEDEPDNGWSDEMAVGVATMLYLAGEDGTATIEGGMGGMLFGGSPTGYLDAIEQMSTPKVTDADTVVATLQAPDEFVEAFGRPIPDGAVELDLGPDDRPTGLRLSLAAGGSSSSLDFTFTDWDTPIDIALPGDDEVDATPWVEEELIRAAGVVPVLPSAPPAGLDPPTFDVEPLSTYSEDAPEDCDVIDIYYYAPMEDESGEYVSLSLTTAECAMAVDPTPFAPGGPGGRTSREVGAELLQLQIGETNVEIDTSLEGADLDAFVRTLAPVDMETFIAKAAEEPADWAL